MAYNISGKPGVILFENGSILSGGVLSNHLSADHAIRSIHLPKQKKILLTNTQLKLFHCHKLSY